MKKVLLKKFLVCILIVVIMFNFLSNIGNVVYAADATDDGPDIGSAVVGTFSNIVSGLVGVLLWPITIVPTAILIGISDLIGGLARIGFKDIKSYNEKGVDFVILTPFHILFNKIPLVDVNFFDFDFNNPGDSNTIQQFRQSVAGWYYTMRLIAAMILLVILIYLGVRMAITSIATEKAIYKKMLVDWVTSLCLLFLLHYIMLFILECNNALVGAMEGIADNVDGVEHIMTSIQAMCIICPDIIMRVAAIIIYGMLVFQTISFLVSYIKRMFTIGFLIIIAPLITITYSIDKIGDGKAQALNTWLKEFSYNILLQPFQCILYLVFANLAYQSMFRFSFERLTQNNVGVCIFAILSLQFIKEGEKIVKKIFGFGKASTVGDLAVGAAMTAGALMKGKDVAKKYGGAIAKTKNRIIGSEAAKPLRDYFSNEFKNTKLGKAANKLSNAKSTVAHYASFGYLPKNTKSTSENNNETSKTKKQRFKSNTNYSSLLNKAKKGVNKTLNSTESAVKIANKKFTKTNNSSENNTTKDKGKTTNDGKDKTAKKDINGAKGRMTFGSALLKSSGAAITGIRDFAWDHKKDIRGMTVGMFTAGIGLAAGDFGDISKGIAGYNMGKGFSEGIYDYSAKQLKEDSEAAIQMLANLLGVDNVDALLAMSDAVDLSELNKQIREAISKLETKMENCNVDASMLGDFADIAKSKTEAGTLTKDVISEMLDKKGFKATDGYTKEMAVKEFSDLGVLFGKQTLNKNIQNAESMEIDRETLAQWLGGTGSSNITVDDIQRTSDSTEPSGDTSSEEKANGGKLHDSITTVHNQNEIHEKYEDTDIISNMDSDALASEIIDKLPDLNDSSISSLEIDETNTKIDNLNVLINELNNKTSAQQTEILNAVNSNNKNITQYNDIITKLKGQRDILIEHKNSLDANISNIEQGNE